MCIFKGWISQYVNHISIFLIIWGRKRKTMRLRSLWVITEINKKIAGLSLGGTLTHVKRGTSSQRSNQRERGAHTPDERHSRQRHILSGTDSEGWTCSARISLSLSSLSYKRSLVTTLFFSSWGQYCTLLKAIKLPSFKMFHKSGFHCLTDLFFIRQH